MSICRVLSLLLAFPLIAGAAGNDWMSFRNGASRLSELSIPGTHDSGALHEPAPGTSKCQDLSIAEQLDVGVRFLDVRCRHVNDAFAIHHGRVYQRQNFADVLSVVTQFLAANPGETVIMSVKEEYDPVGNTRTFEETFDDYVARDPRRWRLDAEIPTLDRARGRIVLLRRFGVKNGPKGVDASDWPDNATFERGRLRVQDAYRVASTDEKWRAIVSMFDETEARPPDALHLNFCSGFETVAGIPNITKVASDINPRLVAHLKANPGRRRGVVVMDFVDAAKCNLVIGGGTERP